MRNCCYLILCPPPGLSLGNKLGNQPKRQHVGESSSPTGLSVPDLEHIAEAVGKSPLPIMSVPTTSFPANPKFAQSVRSQLTALAGKSACASQSVQDANAIKNLKPAPGVGSSVAVPDYLVASHTVVDVHSPGASASTKKLAISRLGAVTDYTFGSMNHGDAKARPPSPPRSRPRFFPEMGVAGQMPSGLSGLVGIYLPRVI